MSRADESLERVLASLRDAEAPEGMAARVLRALEKSERAAVGRHGRSARWTVGWAPASAAGFAAVAVIMFAVLALGMRRQTEAPRTRTANSPAVVETTHIIPPVIGHASNARPRSVSPAPVRFRVDGRRVTARVASRPAPPMEITHEEKLLLQVAHTRDPQVLELLNPEAQKKQEMEAKAEFDQFFETPVPANQQ